MDDTVTLESFKKMREILEQNNISPSPFLILMHPDDLLKVFDVELNLDQNGQQQIGDCIVSLVDQKDI